ncbi:MAG: endonuclease MutS2, partial [Prevotella sp.]|nr:endonuclease MutS2 [Prevotella sp.]
MIYPNNFELKIGFNEIRQLLYEHCLSILGKDAVEKISISTDINQINTWLRQTKEFRLLMETAEDFPLRYFFDLREVLNRLRLEGTHAEESELHDLRRSLQTITELVSYLRKQESDERKAYPTLSKLTDNVKTFPNIVSGIDKILDKYGKMRDNASPELANIRKELTKIESTISHTLYNILRSAQSEGVIEKDATPTMRDGRLVLPIAPALKRRVKGIVHDESSSGKTVFVEPTEVVEANNKIRELEIEERREIIRILTVFAKELRPYIPDLLFSYKFLAKVDLIYAKSEVAKLMNAFEPIVEKKPLIDWIEARHPLLERSLLKQNKKNIPLDIILKEQQRLLIISGPNAGGKSVCLKTVGLLQYMLQCGLSVPMNEHSHVGLFKNIMIDIGDEQSIDDDLSTYSSHLTNMKQMIRHADAMTLLLIDEFGGGTEPTIGGAIAESVLKQFWKNKAWGVITTHYQNLKHFAEEHDGVINGAMLYDRHEMRPLFQLQIGRPGSSFAIEIARKIGLPNEVINDASEIVGSDYIHSDR